MVGMRGLVASTREQHSSPQHLEEDEAENIIAKLKPGKKAGVDKIVNESFKMGKEILIPYLEHVINACLQLCYFPTQYKIAQTIILKKADKKTYAEPASFKPITILSHLSKILEKVIANRLVRLALAYHLVPDKQMPFLGRSTTAALHSLLDSIYSAWSAGKVIQCTLLCLDISGAYDRALLDRLLVVLAEKGVPDWRLQLVRSFLIGRKTSLHVPGGSLEEFWVNIGLPQGSALSPILFLLFAAPLLELFTDFPNINASGFSDDTNLLAISPTFERNCELLTDAHIKIMQWADSNGVHFSPAKYKLIHFTQPWHHGKPEMLPEIDGLKQSKQLQP